MYQARRTPSFDSPAAWAEILRGYSKPVPLEGTHTADVVVIGAGFAGLSAARRLRQLDPTLNIAVVDALRVGEGSAGRNSGFMIDLPHDLASDDYAGGTDDRALITLNRAAISFVQEAVVDYQINPAFADPAGKVNGAASPAGEAHNESYAAHLTRLGEAYEMLDARDMWALTGSRYYRSGLQTPGTLMLQPAGYVQGLASGLQREGVQIFQNSPVVRFERETSGWHVATMRGQISTAKIILANNGHLESFGIAQGSLMHIFLFASMTPELSAPEINALGGQPRWGVTPADPMGTTMRRIDAGQGGNRIVTRTCAVFRPGMRSSQADLNRAAAVQQRKFDARFPELSGMQMAYKWAGHLCLTRNGVSVTGEIEDGVYSACVQNGLGTARGTLTGIAASEIALGKVSNITEHFCNEPAPRALPPRPFATLGANAYLRWKEYQARAE